MTVQSRNALAPVLRGLQAVVLDTDGVITDSARVHAAAWKTAFDAFLSEHPPQDPGQRRPFDVRDDYLRYVDGKSRIDGAAAFLASRGFEPSAETVTAVAADKERLFTTPARARRRRVPRHGATGAGPEPGGRSRGRRIRLPSCR